MNDLPTVSCRAAAEENRHRQTCVDTNAAEVAPFFHAYPIETRNLGRLRYFAMEATALLNQPLIVIFGATHVGLRLARRLTLAGHRVRVTDHAAAPPETPEGWEYASADLNSPSNLDDARLVYIVTDEDKLNIRLALAVRSAYPDVHIVITLVQARLGKKLARHLQHFSFISPPELAAKKFVGAIDAPLPLATNPQPPLEIEPEPDLPKSWPLIRWCYAL